MSIEGLNPNLTKRDFLKLSLKSAAAAGGAAFLAANPVFAAIAEALGATPEPKKGTSPEMVVSRNAWTTRFWWPIFTETGINRGLPKLHDDWWPAHILDLLSHAEGRESSIQEQAKAKAEMVKANRPESISYAGYCPWVSIAQLLEEKPQAFPGEDLAGETDPERIIELKQGMLAIKHAGDILVPVPSTRETLMAALQNRLPVIVNYPANLGAGDWFRSLLGTDGGLVRVTNFGAAHVDLPISGINGAYVVYPSDSSETFATGIRENTSFWRYEVDRNFIDRVVYRR